MRACCRTLRPPPAPCWLRQGCQQAPMSRRRLSLAQRAPADQPRPRRARADRQCVHTLATRPCPSETTRASSKQETERLRFRKCSRVEERAFHRELHTFGLRPDSHRVRLSSEGGGARSQRALSWGSLKRSRSFDHRSLPKGMVKPGPRRRTTSQRRLARHTSRRSNTPRGPGHAVTTHRGGDTRYSQQRW